MKPRFHICLIIISLSFFISILNTTTQGLTITCVYRVIRKKCPSEFDTKSKVVKLGLLLLAESQDGPGPPNDTGTPSRDLPLELLSSFDGKGALFF